MPVHAVGEAQISEKYESIKPYLNEKTRRIWAATEARAMGRGGVSEVARATGLSRTTIYKAVAELDQPIAERMEINPSAIRQTGGGRKSLSETDPQLLEDLQELMSATTRGDPQSPLLWTTKSTIHLAEELQAMGHRVSQTSIWRLLNAMDYSLQVNRKVHEGEDHPQRDEQFLHIASSPLISRGLLLAKQLQVKQDSRPATQPQQKRTQLPTFEFEVVTVDAKGKIVDRQQREAEYYREDLGDSVSLDLVVIPGGTFLMGQTEAEKVELQLPQHEVTVPAFLMSKYSVTQSQYQKVMGDNPSLFKGENRPVENVTWHQAVEFCQRLSQQTGREYRLASEAEWEYACRAGTMTPFHFGETITTELANYRGTDMEYKGKTYSGKYGQEPHGSYREQTTDVGSFPPNAFGLYDMHGNVWEWCEDVWHANYEGAPDDGSAWIEGGNQNRRALRGGAWHSFPWLCLSVIRTADNPDDHFSSIGFRVCCCFDYAQHKEAS